MSMKIRDSVTDIYKKISNMRIAWKFTCAYFIILALPIIGTGILIHVTTTKSFIHQSELLARQSLLQKREIINQKIESIEKTSISIAQNPQILNFLEEPFENNRKGYENYFYFFNPVYESYIIQNKYIYGTMLYINNKTFPNSWNSIYHIDVKEDNEEYRAFLEDENMLQKWNTIHYTEKEVYSRTTVKERVFSLSRKLISFVDKKLIGVLVIEITEKELFDNLNNNDTNEYYLVFDEKGNMVSESTYKNLPDKYKTSFISVLQGGNEINGVTEFENERFIVWSIPLERIGFSLVGITPLRNYTGNMPNYTLIIIIVIVAALIVFGVLIYFVSDKLTRRLKILLQGLKSVRNQNINIKLPVESYDEFGELAVNFNHMTDRIHELIERVYKAQIVEKESELKALEAQINPHFLYNTLSTISWMARKVNAENIEELAFMLSKFYRLVLSKGNSIITVRDEIELLKAYIEIEKTRFDNLFNVKYELDKDALDYRMIKIILQPIAENAINHGIAPKGYTGTLIVRLKHDDENLYFSIIDDGVGISRNVLQSIYKSEIAKKRESGYAIQNVMERINAVYEDKGHISIFSRPGIGCSVTITIPKTIDFLNL